MSRALSLALSVFLVACAGPPMPEPLRARKVTVGEQQQLSVSHTLILFDSSGTVDRVFPEQKALLEGFVAGMPDGRYRSGLVAFGGFERQVFPLERFDRARMQRAAADVSFLSEATPFDLVFQEAAEMLEGARGSVALVVISDGLPSDLGGRDVDGAAALEAARALVAAQRGDVCIHTIQSGDDPRGAGFMARLAGLTSCGSKHASAALDSTDFLYGFQRAVFLRDRPLPPVAAAPPVIDTDRDGYPDARDRCPNTPRGVRVDGVGCWQIRPIAFETDRSDLGAETRAELAKVVSVLRENSKVRLRVAGYTDSRGGAAYNQKLSLRRANAVRDFLVSAGVAKQRLEIAGLGTQRQVSAGTDPAALRANRRVELTQLQ